MRRLLIACVAVAGCGNGSSPAPAPPPQAEALWPAPERYEVDAKWQAGRLAGRMRLTLRNTGPRPLTEIWLRTWPNAFGSCAKPLATLTPSHGGRENCTAQRLRLAAPLARGARTTVALEFAVDVPPGADRFGRTRDVAYLGNALPTLAVADRDGWRLPPYFDQGEAWFSLAADWRVKVDTDLAVAATGVETAPGVFEANDARDFAMAIGRLTATEDRVGDITVRHHALPGQPPAAAQRAIRAAKAALEAFGRWYGPYGRAEIDLVQGPAEVATRGIAMEYPELILTPPDGATVAHEVAHQWWAFIMGNDPYREPFLDEGFAEYSAARLPRSITGGDRLGRCPRPSTPPSPPLSADVPTLDRAGGRTYVRTVYLATGCFLRRLERALGSARLDAMLQGLVRRHRDRTWTRADLIAALERAAPDSLDVDALLKREAIRRPAS